jgi:hypothetical protein
VGKEMFGGCKVEVSIIEMDFGITQLNRRRELKQHCSLTTIIIFTPQINNLFPFPSFHFLIEYFSSIIPYSSFIFPEIPFYKVIPSS